MASDGARKSEGYHATRTAQCTEMVASVAGDQHAHEKVVDFVNEVKIKEPAQLSNVFGRSFVPTYLLA